MRRLAIALGAVGLSLLVVGLALQVVLLPGFTRALVKYVDSRELAGLSQETTLRLAEEVRVYVSVSDAPMLPGTVDGRPGFDERQSSHLDDVRAVILPATWLTWGLLAGAVIWLALVVHSEGATRDALRRAARVAGIAVLVTVPVAGLAGVADFDTLFTRFHGLFFAEGTWQFYSTDLIIQLFPESFWVIAGAAWGLLAMVFAACLAAAARRLGAPHETPQE